MTKMKSTPYFVFPPGWSPFSPFLALPALKGFLENQGTPVEIRDLNLDFYDYVLNQNTLDTASKRIEKEFNALDSGIELDSIDCNRYAELVRAYLCFDAIQTCEPAKEIIRSADYYDPGKAQTAFKSLSDALHLFSASYHGLHVGFNQLSLKYKNTSTRQVLDAIGDIKANPFIDFYQHRVINELQSLGTETLGISITGSAQLIPALTLIQLVKTQCPAIRHIVVGGNFITRVASLWAKPHPFFRLFDFLVAYEGEYGVLELLRCLEEGGDLKNVPNLVYVSGTELVRNPLMSVPIEALPDPDFTGYANVPYLLPELVLPIQASRGCPSQCSFCTIPFGQSGKFRQRSAECVYSMLERLSKRFGTTRFAIIDDTLTLPLMLELSDLIKKRNSPIKWNCETRFSPKLTVDACKILYEGGCRRILFGLESYNQRILDLMNKHTRVEWIEPGINNCHAAGIAVHLFVMVGFPTETYDEANRTFAFTKQVLNNARKSYGMTRSTRGSSVFGLDKYSPVWLKPSDYSITIIEDTLDNDLDISSRFSVSKGLTPMEAEDLLKTYNASAYDLAGNSDWVPLAERPTDFFSEEGAFLHLCREESGQKTDPSRAETLPRFIEDLVGETEIWFEEGTAVLPLGRDLSKPQLPRNGSIVIYNRQIGRARLLSAQAGDAIQWLLGTGRTTVASFCAAGFHAHLHDLMNSTLLCIQSSSKERKSDVTTSRLVINPTLVTFSRTNHIFGPNHHMEVVLSGNTGRTMRINSGSLQVIERFRHPKSPKTVLADMLRENQQISSNQFAEFITNCINNSILEYSALDNI